MLYHIKKHLEISTNSPYKKSCHEPSLDYLSITGNPCTSLCCHCGGRSGRHNARNVCNHRGGRTCTGCSTSLAPHRCKKAKGVKEIGVSRAVFCCTASEPTGEKYVSPTAKKRRIGRGILTLHFPL